MAGLVGILLGVYFEFLQLYITTMSNWDDDFDFDDDAPKKKPAAPKKKDKDNDFFDEDNKTSKLPTISSKPNISRQTPQSKRSSARPNPYADNMKLRGNVYDDDENVYQEIEDEPKPKLNAKNDPPKKNKDKEPDNDFNYYEELDDVPKKDTPPKRESKQYKSVSNADNYSNKKQEPKEEDNYYEEEFQENYGDDFEEVVDESPKKEDKKVIRTDPPSKKQIVISQNKVQLQTNQNNIPKKLIIPPKPPSASQKKQQQQQQQQPSGAATRNQTVQKNIKNIARSNSRNNLKSAESKRPKQSRVTNKLSTNVSFVPNKYSIQIQRSFPSTNLNDMNQDKLNKLNERLRGMIKKFNEELNQLINKNMLYLKVKKNQKTVSLDSKLKVLEEQSKNNQTMLELMQKEFDKLAGRDGELREEEYQLMTQKKIQQTKQSIKQAQKAIIKLKNEIKSQGNKLTNKSQDKKLVAELHHLKTTLIQSKKDEEKHNDSIKKLDDQLQDLGEKVTDAQYRLSEMIDQAREKGIQLESKEEINKKFDNMKKKVEASRNHRSKLENLLKTKSDIISHEKDQMRINIKNCELEIKNLYDSISHVHNESIKVVEKAKTNPKLSPNVVSDLDSILKALEIVQSDNYSVRSQDNRSDHGGPLKNIAANMDKSEPHKRTESANGKQGRTSHSVADDHKPNLLKKKNKGNQEEHNERIWREEEKQKGMKAQKKDEQIKKETVPIKEPEKPVEEEKDKKKPFTLKKNRVGENKVEQQQQKVEQPKLELAEQKKPEEEKKEQISSAGPRMMKFKRRGNEEREKQPAKDIIKEEQKPKLNLQIKEEPKQEQDKPIFVPKRFNLRNKQQKKDDSYMPSMESKEKEEPKKEDIVVEKKEDKKFNLNDIEDSSRKPINDPYAKKEQPSNSIHVPEEKISEDETKPKFSLKLRDRKKVNEEGGGGYAPTIAENKPIEEKPIFNIPSKNNIEKPKQNPSNPYAPKESTNNPYAPKQNTNNPYAPKDNTSNPKQNPSNPYAPKEQTNNPYAPSINIGAKKQGNEPQKVEEEPPSNPNNPYTQNQGNPGGVTRQKEGPVKKPKIQQMGQKQKINIYEQAEEAEGLNQFQPPPPAQKEPVQNSHNPIATKDLNLNDLLGVNNKKKVDDLADLIGGGGGSKKAKKNNDFFGDLDI